MSFLLRFFLPTSGFFSSIIQLLASTLPKVFDLIQPLWVVLVQFFAWYFKQFWLGLTAILHNIAVLTVIAPLLLFTSGYVQWKEEKQCRQSIATIHKEYTLTKKNGKTQKKLTKEETTYQEWNPFKNVWEKL